MRRRLKAVLLLACLALATASAPSATTASAGRPAGFFGIDPQTALTDQDIRYMRAGGIEAIRVPFPWGLIQPTAKGHYDWTGTDAIVEMATKRGLRVMPFLYGTPHWLAAKPTSLPIDSGRARRAWKAFVEAAVERYGPGGEFWTEHAPDAAVVNYLPPIPTPMPIHAWQVWNEANFFYFAYPVSPNRYARLLKLAAPAIKAVDPTAEVILSGLFGNPDEGGKRGMDATAFLEALYRVPGIKADFDAAALHPYAFHVEDLEALTSETREVMLEHNDGAAGLYITEMGWGSQNDPNVVAFEQGPQGQARELRGAYGYLIANRRRLNLKGVYWYSWKDNPEYTECHFCDSVGLFRAGLRFHPKPAWRAFIGLTGGRLRP
jgi:polysaccharide biosynthesis protein PslG